MCACAHGPCRPQRRERAGVHPTAPHVGQKHTRLKAKASLPELSRPSAPEDSVFPRTSLPLALVLCGHSATAGSVRVLTHPCPAFANPLPCAAVWGILLRTLICSQGPYTGGMDVCTHNAISHLTLLH